MDGFSDPVGAGPFPSLSSSSSTGLTSFSMAQRPEIQPRLSVEELAHGMTYANFLNHVQKGHAEVRREKVPLPFVVLLTFFSPALLPFWPSAANVQLASSSGPSTQGQTSVGFFLSGYKHLLLTALSLQARPSSGAQDYLRRRRPIPPHLSSRSRHRSQLPRRRICA